MVGAGEDEFFDLSIRCNGFLGAFFETMGVLDRNRWVGFTVDDKNGAGGFFQVLALDEVFIFIYEFLPNGISHAIHVTARLELFDGGGIGAGGDEIAALCGGGPEGE